MLEMMVPRRTTMDSPEVSKHYEPPNLNNSNLKKTLKNSSEANECEKTSREEKDCKRKKILRPPFPEKKISN